MGFIIIGTAIVLFFFIFRQQLSGGFFPGKPITLTDFVGQTISRYGLDRSLVKAIIKVESNGNTKAFNPAGPSYGLMQITPILAQTYGLIKDAKNVTENDISLMMDVANNAELGCRFLSYLLKRYSRSVAIQMYNVGEAGYNGGKRVQSYLDKVLYWYELYRASGGLLIEQGQSFIY
jgi:soluble lytic murein transglycosylase-like protein